MAGVRSLAWLVVLAACNGDGGSDSDTDGGDALSCHVAAGAASDYEQCAEYVGLDEAGVEAVCDVFPGVVEHHACSQEGAIGTCAMPDGGSITYYEDSADQYPDGMCAQLGGTWTPAG